MIEQEKLENYLEAHLETAKVIKAMAQEIATLREFKAHAVEVLASMIFQRKKILRFSEEEARAEARALLGWEE